MHLGVGLTRPNIKDSNITLLTRDAITGTSVLDNEMLLYLHSLFHIGLSPADLTS